MRGGDGDAAGERACEQCEQPSSLVVVAYESEMAQRLRQVGRHVVTMAVSVLRSSPVSVRHLPPC